MTNQHNLFDSLATPSTPSTPSGPTRAEIENAYHNTGRPLITDAEYDLLQPPEDVGAPVPAGVSTITHRFPMLSLEKAHTRDDIIRFLNSILSLLGTTALPDIYSDLKIDGLSCSITFQDGIFSMAATRGNHTVGEDISEAVRNLPTVPDTVPATGTFTINGEISIPRPSFLALNKQMALEGEDPYSTPRNTSAGIIRDNDKTRAAKVGIEFIAWSLPDPETPGNSSVTAAHALMKSYGFKTPERHLHIPASSRTPEEIADDILAWFDTILAERPSMEHDIDGIVIKIDLTTLQQELGVRHRSPYWAISLKPPPECAITRLTAIDVQVGSTGALTPVAILEPVTIGGVVVTRASLHNEDQIATKDIRIGDSILIERAGDVIPKVISVHGDHAADSTPWTFPATCPDCGSPTARDETSGDGVIRYCTAIMTCPGTRNKRFTRLVGRSILDIDGIAISAITEFCNLGFLSAPADLYRLPEKTEHAAIKGWGPGKQKNLREAITKARTVPLERFLMSLLIRHLGESASKTLAHHYQTIENFLADIPSIAANDEQAIKTLQSLPDFGTILTSNMTKWLSSEANLAALHDLLSEITVSPVAQTKSTASSNILQDEVIVFTGVMSHMTRDQMRAHAEDLGADTSDSVTKKTTILVWGENAGSKKEKAQKLAEKNHPIKIMSENEWSDFLAERQQKE